MKIRRYTAGNLGLRIALLADLHNRPWESILKQTNTEKPDLICVAGDTTHNAGETHRVPEFLAACASLCPTFLSLGNHDSRPADSCYRATGAVLLDNAYIDITVKDHPIRIGGLTSPQSRGISAMAAAPRIPQTQWLSDFTATEQYKILLCHQPEFFPRYLEHLPIDLVLSGHAHGGQWRIGNQGVFAPGQGLFPKLTGGMHRSTCGPAKLVISRGLSNTTVIPRFFNPREIIIVDF